MSESRQTVSETLAEIATRRPVLQPVLKAFAPLLEARAALPEKLAPLLEESGFALPPWRQERAQQGAPLLAGASLNGLYPLLLESAKTLLPLMASMPGLGEHAEALKTFFQNETLTLKASDTLLTGHETALTQTAEQTTIPSAVLLFAVEAVVGPVLHTLAKKI